MVENDEMMNDTLFLTLHNILRGTRTAGRSELRNCWPCFLCMCSCLADDLRQRSSRLDATSSISLDEERCNSEYLEVVVEQRVNHK